MSRYTDGHGFCFSCQAWEPGLDSELTSHRSSPSTFMNYTGDIVRLANRAITEETCKKFNVRVDKTNAGYVLRFPYYSATGSLVAFKERTEDKQFTLVGKNSDKQLFGQQLFGTGKTLVITEGELDCLATWQARPNWPVVSIPTGAAGAKRALENQLSWCLGFDEIILLFDTDEPGIKAAQDCASLFPADRIFVANVSPYKDANEALMDRNSDAIRQAIWNKRPYTPQAIIDGRDLFELVTKPMRGQDALWPFSQLNTVLGGCV